MMKEEEASLMIIRHAIEALDAEKRQQVIACAAEIRDVMSSFDSEHADLALMLVAAEVAAD
ncbi:hypothetical protein NB724_001202 [Pantoea ananatis]|jgi:hypothetical protein|uniref:Uncharacterized protein n=3 Tax=Pantoea ananas TaxID=553 RepID=D4GCN5_PANAM|nr:Hypothetical Protein PANA_1541 [Pantoea ananatis LMG 20103]AER33102.1 hypothetical protein PAGR_g2603 [Pantoea ananatis PA13]AWQ19199.1 hypothetical protein C1N63_10365 [Pantoea ananatis]OWY78093.1 hypothetical protein CDN97_07635 [Pantoea sp. AMG 501]MCW0305997.1 hypothetical protein [Pantoea ananatis]